ADRKKSKSKFDLHFCVIRLQLRVFLQQWIGLGYLSLVIVQNPQSTLRHRIVWSEAEHLTIVLLCLAKSLGSKGFVGARQNLVLGRRLIRATGNRERCN